MFGRFAVVSFDTVFKEIHMQRHNGEKKYLCTTCNKKFATENHLIMHLNAHSDPRIVSARPPMSVLNNNLFARRFQPRLKHEISNWITVVNIVRKSLHGHMKKLNMSEFTRVAYETN